MSLISSIAKFINDKMVKYPRVSFIISKILPKNKILFGKVYSYTYNSIDFENGINETKLLKIVNSSVKNVPYYSKIYNSKFETIQKFEASFQFIDKSILAQNSQDLLSNTFKKSENDLVTTGGTSGPPTKFFVNKKRYQKEYAFYHKIWATKGYKGQLRGVIRNHKLPEDRDFEINPITKEIVFDAFRNNKEYYLKIYKILTRYSIVYLQCYPSSAYHFVKAIYKENLNLNFLKGLFLSSEKYLDYQIDLLKNKLNLPVISIYGHSEKLILAVDFNGDGQYQIVNDYGFFELIDNDGNVIKEIGINGEITGTTFDNFSQPLIRYRTGDYSSYATYNENGKRVLNGIEGRWYDMKIFNDDGTFVTPTALNLHNELYTFIEGLQYYQKKKGELEVRLVPGVGYNVNVEKKLYNHFSSRLSKGTNIKIIKVEQLTKKQNGKFVLLESKVN